MLEESSTSYLGPGCREFESRHSDQSIQIRTFYQLVKGSDLLFISDVEFRGGLIVSPPRNFALRGAEGRSGAFAEFGQASTPRTPRGLLGSRKRLLCPAGSI